MREPLPVGLICLLGPQGSGKTSQINAMVANDYKYHGKERYLKCKNFTNNELNKNGYDLDLPENQVLYFASEKTKLNLKHNIETWYVDPTKFALPNLDFEVQYFPRYSVVTLFEFDNILNCRDWESLSPYFISIAKYARQWDLTILIDLQVLLQIDSSWRRLLMYTVFVMQSYWQTGWRFEFGYNKPPKECLWFKPKRVWNDFWIDNQRNNFAKELSSMMGNVPLVQKFMQSTVTKKRFVFKDNIFKYFDSFSGKAYFLRYIKNYNYIKHGDISLSPANVEIYCEKHPIVRPRDVNKSRNTNTR